MPSDVDHRFTRCRPGLQAMPSGRNQGTLVSNHQSWAGAPDDCSSSSSSSPSARFPALCDASAHVPAGTPPAQGDGIQRAYRMVGRNCISVYPGGVSCFPVSALSAPPHEQIPPKRGPGIVWLRHALPSPLGGNAKGKGGRAYRGATAEGVLRECGQTPQSVARLTWRGPGSHPNGAADHRPPTVTHHVHV